MFDQVRVMTVAHQNREQLKAIKHHPCPMGHDAILLVDLETESVLVLDENGNRQYYCGVCPSFFSVDAHGAIVKDK